MLTLRIDYHVLFEVLSRAQTRYSYGLKVVDIHDIAWIHVLHDFQTQTHFE